jgi:hypothetical protein
MQRHLIRPACPTSVAPEREPPSDPVNLEPATTYEVLTRRMVEDLASEVSAIRNRIDTMFWVVIVSVVTDALLRMAG